MSEPANPITSRGTLIMSRGGSLAKMGFPCNLAIPLHILGRAGEAAKFAEQGLRHARESSYPSGLAFALMVNGYLNLFRREPENLRAHTREAIAVSEECGHINWLVLGRFFHGCAVAELGDLERGVTEMESAMADIHRQGGLPRQHYAAALLAQGYGRIGRTEEALRMLDEALTQIERTGAKLDQAEMLRIKGELLLMRNAGTTVQAESCFREAIQVARAQEARWWELRATATLSKLLRDTGRRAEARAMLAEIYNWFTDGFDTADLKEAKVLLDELGA